MHLDAGYILYEATKNNQWKIILKNGYLDHVDIFSAKIISNILFDLTLHSSTPSSAEKSVLRKRN